MMMPLKLRPVYCYYYYYYYYQDECVVYYCAECSGPDLFKCPNIDRCIRATYVCDGRQDCDDWTDEMNCRQSCLYLSISFNYT